MKKYLENATAMLPKRRAALLQIAYGTCLENYDPENNIVPAGTSDHNWRCHFSSRKLKSSQLKKFIFQYRLHRLGHWDFERCTNYINESNFEYSPFDERCQVFHPTKRSPSAYSKFRFFAKDDQDVFIFDSLVEAAMIARRPADFVRENFDHLMLEAFEKERIKHDFSKMFSALRATLNFSEDRFLERYAFDKLLLAEGRLLRALKSHQTPPPLPLDPTPSHP